MHIPECKILASKMAIKKNSNYKTVDSQFFKTSGDCGFQPIMYRLKRMVCQEANK